MITKQALALAALSLAACTVEHGKVPVIDELILPESVTLDADGTYHVNGTISFHDDDDTVSRVRVQIASLGAKADYPATGGKSAVKAPLTLKVVGSAPKGELQLTVWILDIEGNISDPKTPKITLK